MTRSIHTQGILEDFINKLASCGYSVELFKKRPQIFYIDNEPVNIRCRGRYKKIAGGRSFWYSIAFNVLQEVKWVIYITTTSDYFFMFPSTFLENLKDRMYPDANKAGVGVFDLDWDNEMIVLRQGDVIRISEYYRNFIHRDDYPKF